MIKDSSEGMPTRKSSNTTARQVSSGRKEFQWLVGLGRKELPALGTKNFKGQLATGEEEFQRTVGHAKLSSARAHRHQVANQTPYLQEQILKFPIFKDLFAVSRGRRRMQPHSGHPGHPGVPPNVGRSAKSRPFTKPALARNSRISV